ncbi:uncharacterized protein LOC143252080 isoform X2 [Tachypleus tridentatus]|uniref:uncharacterized protein LOC143252080 isoform X2 n=1 Tax=Tachypleus tridentatus TaxID=6853 RepID=UPI003FD193B9
MILKGLILIMCVLSAYGMCRLCTSIRSRLQNLVRTCGVEEGLPLSTNLTSDQATCILNACPNSVFGRFPAPGKKRSLAGGFDRFQSTNLEPDSSAQSAREVNVVNHFPDFIKSEDLSDETHGDTTELLAEPE